MADDFDALSAVAVPERDDDLRLCDREEHQYTVYTGRSIGPARYIGPDEAVAVAAFRALDPVLDEGWVYADHFIRGAAEHCPAESQRLMTKGARQ